MLDWTSKYSGRGEAGDRRLELVVRDLWCIVAASLLVGGCGNHTPETPLIVLCVGPRAAIAVRVRDAQTGLFIGTGATAIASIGTSYADTVRIASTDPDSTPAYVGNRPGTFDVTVRKAGYADWSQKGIVVLPNLVPCDAEPVTTSIVATLTKAP